MMSLERGVTATNGGAINNNGGTVTIDNSTLQNNRSNAPATTGGGGGAIYNENNGSITIQNGSLLNGNQSTDIGGAIFSISGPVIVDNSIVSNNQSNEEGGGISSGGTLNVRNNSQIISNVTLRNGEGGGIFGAMFSTVTIDNSLISDNTSTNTRGGGIASRGDLTITNSTISNNAAYYFGGGIMHVGQLDISNSLITGNSATWTGFSEGGGLMVNPSTNTANITDTVFSNNSAYRGGGIYGVGPNIYFTNCTISNNTATNQGGGYYSSDLRHYFFNSLIINNTAGDSGGGIYSRIDVYLYNSTVSGNQATNNGGGIANSSLVQLTDSTVSNNRAGNDGGGIWNDGHPLIVDNSTISNNLAGNDGGGIWNNNNASATITNSTISGNTATNNGGGIYAQYNLPIVNSTITNNSAASGLGIYAAAGTATVSNSIVASQTGGPDCVIGGGVIVTNGYNIESGTACGFTAGGDQQNVSDADLNLGPLADNGGPTQTHLPGAGSFALDQIPLAACPVATDQRGITRPQALVCDVGSVEVEATIPLVAAAACNGNDLDVTITAGDHNFDITGAGSGLPLNGVGTGTHTLTGPDTWTGVRVTELTGDTESANLGDFTCGPEIDVQRPASIADGGNDPVGAQPVGLTTLTYTIENTGTGSLTIPAGGVTATNLTNVSGFTVNTGLPLNVPAGTTGTLQIQFNIDAAGAFSFDMDIDSNDADENPYDINVWGTGTNNLAATAACNGNDLDVNITDGDNPFDIAGTSGPGLPQLGVGMGITTLIGPASWTGVTVTETGGDLESANLGNFTCPPPVVVGGAGGGGGAAQVQAPGCNLTIDVEADHEVVTPGDQVVWTVLIRNPGPADCHGVQTYGTMPGEFAITDINTTRGSINWDGGQYYLVELGTILANDQAAVTLDSLLQGGAAFVLPEGAAAQSAGQQICLTGYITEPVNDTDCVMLFPDTLPATGGEPVSPSPNWGWVVAAGMLIIGLGGYMVRQRRVF
jgi:predicted outer membrane repeat protein